MLHKTKGFTLLELLIVIGILAILATTTVLVLNPAELLRQARDSQRISDLQTINSALSLYVTTVTNPSLSTSTCANGTYTGVAPSSSFGAACVAGTGPVTGQWAKNSRSIDNSGWIPVNFGSIPGGSPLSALPLDPTNASGTLATSTNNLVYFYRCDRTNMTWELNGIFESTKYNTTDNVPGKDGGTCDFVYEIGTDPGLNL